MWLQIYTPTFRERNIWWYTLIVSEEKEYPKIDSTIDKRIQHGLGIPDSEYELSATPILIVITRNVGFADDYVNAIMYFKDLASLVCDMLANNLN